MMKKDLKKPERAKTDKAEPMVSPVQRLKSAFVRPEGGLRTGWMLLCALILYRGVSYVLRIGLNLAFIRLFSAWRVTASNIHLAPRWAQAIFSWHGSVITVVVCLAAIGVSLMLRRWWPGRSKTACDVRRGILLACVGAGIAAVSAGLFLILDSMRLEWPMLEPRISISAVIMLPVTLLTTLSEELFTRAVVFDGIAGRCRRIWAYVLSAGAFFFFNGGYAGTAVSGINVFLMGLTCCMLYDRFGLWASTLFRGAWSYVSVFILGFGTTGAAQSVYALYGVSENWLTGGDGGLIYGLWMTAALLGIMAWMRRGILFKWFRTVKKPVASKKA